MKLLHQAKGEHTSESMSTRSSFATPKEGRRLHRVSVRPKHCCILCCSSSSLAIFGSMVPQAMPPLCLLSDVFAHLRASGCLSARALARDWLSFLKAVGAQAVLTEGTFHDIDAQKTLGPELRRQFWLGRLCCTSLAPGTIVNAFHAAAPNLQGNRSE